MLDIKSFKKIQDDTPFFDSTDIRINRHKFVPINFYLSSNELDHFEELMSRKGNCSTNDAASKIAFGDIFNSHSLPFYLYNFSALQVIDRFVKDKETCSILELGCNNGHVSRLLQRNNFKFKEYWGVDFDFSFIVEGIEAFNEKDDLMTSNFCSGDFNKPLNFRNDYFGLVYFQEAFDHCRDKFFYAEQCMSELKRVLKPKGYAYLTLVFEHENRDLYHWDHNYTWDKFQFENMVRDYFEIVNFTPLLTFEQTLHESSDANINKAYNNWPKKFSKMICAHFVDEKDTAVGAYLLQKV